MTEVIVFELAMWKSIKAQLLIDSWYKKALKRRPISKIYSLIKSSSLQFFEATFISSSQVMKVYYILVLTLCLVHQISCGGDTFAPKPTPLICDPRSRDILAPNGTYIKTACYIATQHSFNDAMNICASNGMALYRLTDQASYDGFISTVTSQWPPNFNAAFWLDGKYTGGIWKTHDGVTLYSSMLWLETTHPFTCLRIINPGPAFGATSMDCNVIMSLWCEFDKS